MMAVNCARGKSTETWSSAVTAVSPAPYRFETSTARAANSGVSGKAVIVITFDRAVFCAMAHAHAAAVGPAVSLPDGPASPAATPQVDTLTGMFTRTALVAVSLCSTGLLLAACSSGDSTTDATSSTAAATTTSSTSAPATTTAAATATRPGVAVTDSVQWVPSSDAHLTVTGVTVEQFGDGARVTYKFVGTGMPGVRASLVDAAHQQGSGMVVPIEGKRIIELLIDGTVYPFDLNVGGVSPDPVHGLDGSVVTEVVGTSVFEGVTQSFIGTTTDHPTFTIDYSGHNSELTVEVSGS